MYASGFNLILLQPMPSYKTFGAVGSEAASLQLLNLHFNWCVASCVKERKWLIYAAVRTKTMTVELLHTRYLARNYPADSITLWCSFPPISNAVRLSFINLSFSSLTNLTVVFNLGLIIFLSLDFNTTLNWH